jgi:hypothetical protein
VVAISSEEAFLKIKKLAWKLQEEIAADPALAVPSYTWCREQVVELNPLPVTDWEAFVKSCKAHARRAG